MGQVRHGSATTTGRRVSVRPSRNGHGGGYVPLMSHFSALGSINQN